MKAMWRAGNSGRLGASSRTGWIAALGAMVFGLIGVGLHRPSSAAEVIPDRCDACQAYFTNFIYYAQDELRDVKRHYCESCSDATQQCWACDLPVHEKTMLKLDDGRLLCHWDRQGVVLTDEQARDLFQTHVREWQNLLSPWPPFPQNNVQVHLVNRDDFIREYHRKPRFDNPELLAGLAHSQREEADGKAEHHIYVLSGLLQNRFLAVCAHEYGHTWMFEHNDRKRQIDKDTQEGFCDWLAYKYTVNLGDKLEQDRLLRSDYTHGQSKAFIAAEKEYTFYHVMKWVLKGVDSWLDEKQLGRILVLREDEPSPAPAPPSPSPPALPTPVPDQLILKGISTAGRSRFVLINNKTLGAGESGKVRVGSSNVVVRCLEIRDKSVLIQVKSEPTPRELHLRGAAD